MTIIPTRPADTAANAEPERTPDQARRTFGGRLPSRRTFGGHLPSRRTFGGHLPSRRTFGHNLPSRRTFGVHGS